MEASVALCPRHDMNALQTNKLMDFLILVGVRIKKNIVCDSYLLIQGRETSINKTCKKRLLIFKGHLDQIEINT